MGVLWEAFSTDSLVLSCIVVAIIAATPAAATTWHVPVDAPTIQAGIDSSSVGDTVSVACGTYYEYDITLQSGIHLTSETGDPDCVTIDGQSQGYMLVCHDEGDTTRIVGFTVTGGSGNYGGGILVTADFYHIIDCSFVGNVAIQGGGLHLDTCTSRVTNCTIAGNTATSGGGVFFYYAALIIENSIIAFNTGKSLLGGPGAPTLSCCDIYGNTEGDWIDGFAGQYGVNGNISADPEFCDLGAGNVWLRSNSPCLRGECGQIGAHGQGCLSEAAVIESIYDVGNDQGRNVRLRWQRSEHDKAGEPVVTGYGIYRRHDEHLLGQLPETTAMSAACGAKNRLDGWDFLLTVPAHGDSFYQCIAPTLCDSTADEGICWSVFFIRTMTTDPVLFFDSEPDSGYSVDNLAPAAPANLRWEDLTLLAWDECEDEDFNYFTVYGSGSDVFDPETAEFIGHTVATSLDVTGTDFDYYHTTASDFAGNEGDASTIEREMEGVDDAETLPDAFALYACRPNPFNPKTTIRYDLPRTASTRLCIYDLTGRMIRTLVDAEDHEPGHHWVEWDGRDNAGQSIGSGIYFYHLDAGPLSQTRQMTLLK